MTDEGDFDDDGDPYGEDFYGDEEDDEMDIDDGEECVFVRSILLTPGTTRSRCWNRYLLRRKRYSIPRPLQLGDGSREPQTNHHWARAPVFSVSVVIRVPLTF
jgi:hypothetical protein